MDIANIADATLREAATPGAGDHISVGWLPGNPDSTITLLHALHASPELRILDEPNRHQSDVVLAIADTVDDTVIDALTTVADEATNPKQRTVLVTGQLQRRYLSRVFRAGVVCVLAHHDATPRRITRAILACHHDQAVLPAQLTRWLLDEIRFVHQDLLASQDLAPGGLTTREVEVLKYIAQGDETSEVATKLNYSERTIKKILQTMQTRLHLHNRTHAVSYAMRVGAI
jgi:DNA-binding NarL/FixJ family response regulator